MIGLMFWVGRCPECGARMQRSWGTRGKVLLLAEEGLFYAGIGLLVLGTTSLKYIGAGAFISAVIMYLWLESSVKTSWKCDGCGFVGAPRS